jgi:hypothetical protein
MKNFIKNKALKFERSNFIVNLIFVVLGYVGVTFWLNLVRANASMWIVWILIIIQFLLYFKFFIICYKRYSDCGLSLGYPIFIILCILGRVNNYEVIIVPLVATFMIFISMKNKKISARGKSIFKGVRKNNFIIPLGINSGNKEVNLNLEESLHVLIGGATNSGKTVFIHSLITSLIKKHNPDILRFILVDPKRVDLLVYKNLPHLLVPVIVDYEKMNSTIKWCVKEMNKRYDLLVKNNARNIKKYNKDCNKKIPHVIIIIDEMSDFSVMDDEGELEQNMIRLLQMGRVVGMYFIISSSRPCDETYSEMLRKNFPTRLAFATATKKDSEVIIGTWGAENLSGKGDALLLEKNKNNPVKIQTKHISNKEIENVIKEVFARNNDIKANHI